MLNKILNNNIDLKTAFLPILNGHAINNERRIPLFINDLPEILFITSYPPRECGIATYSQDLIKALNNKFNQSFNISICAIESEQEQHIYNEKVKYTLNADCPLAYKKLANKINNDAAIKIVLIQHEFGFFNKLSVEFNSFLHSLTKPVVMVFHTVLPAPNNLLKKKMQEIVAATTAVIVMTKSSAKILMNVYNVPKKLITIIPHGTHLVLHSDKLLLKEKYHLEGKKVLTTFGLLSSGKSIETTLLAMPSIIKACPDCMFLIIGKTHPSVVKQQGYQYRNMLDAMVRELHLEHHVKYVNSYLPLPELLEYLQLTDIYLFTSKDPNQAVSGTFSYALSCGCPIISTPIPHALEVLKGKAGIIFDFENSAQLSDAVIRLLNNDVVRSKIGLNGLHKMASTAWENSAIAHAKLFDKLAEDQIMLTYKMPAINIDHLKNLTTDFGMIQFSIINQPDINSGFTLDDNARAMVAMCQYFELTNDEAAIKYIEIYLNFIRYCLQQDGSFLNYVNEKGSFTDQNNETNLQDSNGRAIWALGYLISICHLLPSRYKEVAITAELILNASLVSVKKIHSTRALAFTIKGLYYRNTSSISKPDLPLIKELSDRLVQMYRHEADSEWAWFEIYLTYANSILPEAMLCAFLATGDIVYRDIAKSSFNFLCSKIFREDGIKVISNKGWLHKGSQLGNAIPYRYPIGGEQPIDVAYTILALSKFYDAFKDPEYKQNMELSFNWFLGANHLEQIVYNPCTGGCYDGLEENYINLNQGAESTVSYLMARLTMERYFNNKILENDKKKSSLLANLELQYVYQ